MVKKRQEIPRFVTEAEERSFWETHDSMEYLDWTKASEVRLPNLRRLSSIESEFTTEAAAERHDRWVRDKVRRALADTRPTASHDDVMAEMDAIIAEAEAAKSAAE